MINCLALKLLFTDKCYKPRASDNVVGGAPPPWAANPVSLGLSPGVLSTPDSPAHPRVSPPTLPHGPTGDRSSLPGARRVLGGARDARARSFSWSPVPLGSWEQDPRARVILDLASPRSRHRSPVVFDCMGGSSTGCRLPRGLPPVGALEMHLQSWSPVADPDFSKRLGVLFGNDMFGEQGSTSNRFLPYKHFSLSYSFL